MNNNIGTTTYNAILLIPGNVNRAHAANQTANRINLSKNDIFLVSIAFINYNNIFETNENGKVRKPTFPSKESYDLEIFAC